MVGPLVASLQMQSHLEPELAEQLSALVQCQEVYQAFVSLVVHHKDHFGINIGQSQIQRTEM